MVSAILLVAIQAAGGMGTQAVVPAWLLGATVPEGSPAALVIIGVQALVAAVLGGWLGALVLPADPRAR